MFEVVVTCVVSVESFINTCGTQVYLRCICLSHYNHFCSLLFLAYCNAFVRLHKFSYKQTVTVYVIQISICKPSNQGNDV